MTSTERTILSVKLSRFEFLKVIELGLKELRPRLLGYAIDDYRILNSLDPYVQVDFVLTLPTCSTEQPK